MKKIRALIAARLIVVMAAACSGGGLSGTYESQGLIAQKFTFNGNKAQMFAFGVNANGTYEISDGTMCVTYSIFGVDSTWSCEFSKKGSSIYIDGAEFAKSK
jgi:hypothetical protein